MSMEKYTAWATRTHNMLECMMVLLDIDDTVQYDSEYQYAVLRSTVSKSGSNLTSRILLFSGPRRRAGRTRAERQGAGSASDPVGRPGTAGGAARRPAVPDATRHDHERRRPDVGLGT